jgi:DNA polymerase III subunit beta
MLIVASAKQLAEAAAKAAEMSSHSSPQQILNNLLLTAGDGTASFSGSNLDGHMTVTIAAEQTKPGSVAVDGRIAKLLSGFPDGAQAKITMADGVCTLQSGRSRYRIDTLPAEDFPTPFVAEGAVQFSLSDTDRRRLFTVPAPAISDEKTRYYLCGLGLKCLGGRMVSCGTNGHILIRTSIVTDRGFGDVIVPKEACAAIAKLDGCALKIGDNCIEAKTDACHFMHKLIAGAFPSYERVIPPTTGNILEVDRKELIAAFRRISHVTLEKSVTSSVVMEWVDDEVTLRLGNHSDVAEDTLPAITAGRAKTAFSIRLITDLLEAFSGERVVFDSGAYGAPVRITLPGDDDLISVAMPIRVQGLSLEQTGEAA